jgi:hypothetical protein
MTFLSIRNGGHAVVDDEFAHLGNWRWFKSKQGYVVRRFRMPKTKTQKCMFLHHAIIGRPIDGRIIDHLDGNPLNNSIDNLRIVTRRENNQNLRCHRSGHKIGTSMIKNKAKNGNKIYTTWQAQIHVNGKSKYLGAFKTEEEAAERYRQELRKGV